MFSHMLLATDFSPPAMMAATATLQLAKAFEARLTLAHVAHPTGTLSTAQAHEAVGVLHDERFGSAGEVDRLVLTADRAAYAICEAANERGVDLIVAGRHGEHGLAERLIGTTTERIARHAPCSVYVCHPARREQPVMFKHIIVATDLSEHATSALVAARLLAAHFDAYVTLAHVFDFFPAMELLQEPYDLHADASYRGILQDKLEETRKKHLDRVPAEVKILRDKSTVTALCQLASDTSADLLIAGTHGLTGVPRLLLGSVAERLIRHAPCSVLVTRD